MGRASAVKQVAPPLKLDLGCGQNKQAGFTGVDAFTADGVDVVHDLFTFPWPFKSGSVSEVHCAHFFEHIPGPRRGKWMDELHRVLAADGKATIVVPYYANMRAVQDFTHAWPPVAESSFLYFNKQWRMDNKLTHGHYALTCDFDYTYGYSINGTWVSREETARAFAITHYQNVVSDLVVTLTKR